MMRACVRVRECVRVSACMRVRACVRACVRARCSVLLEPARVHLLGSFCACTNVRLCGSCVGVSVCAMRAGDAQRTKC